MKKRLQSSFWGVQALMGVVVLATLFQVTKAYAYPPNEEFEICTYYELDSGQVDEYENPIMTTGQDCQKIKCGATCETRTLPGGNFPCKPQTPADPNVDPVTGKTLFYDTQDCNPAFPGNCNCKTWTNVNVQQRCSCAS